MVWRQRFLVCYFPFLKIEKKNTVDFLSPGSTCFIARHVSIVRSQILFLVISRIPQISVHFPVVSTIGEACLPEVRVFVSFHFSRCRCYPWGLLPLARLIFRRACSFAISENNRSHKKATSLTFSTPSITDPGT